MRIDIHTCVHDTHVSAWGEVCTVINDGVILGNGPQYQLLSLDLYVETKA